MSRVFFKSFFTIFIWILLFANLLYAFNLVRTFTQFMPAGVIFHDYQVDYTQSYFGFSSFIKILQTNPNLAMDGALNELKKFIDYVQSTGSNLWTNNTFDGIWNNIKNIADFFKAVVDSLLVIVRFVGVIGIYVFSMFLTLVYFLLNVVNLFYIIMGFFTGAYAVPLPQTYGIFNVVM